MTLVRLTDIQLVLLATAAQRDNGSLLPPPDMLGDGPARIRKAVQALIRRGLAQETDLVAGADAWRQDGNRAVGVVITDAGRVAIAVESDDANIDTQPDNLKAGSGDQSHTVPVTEAADAAPAPAPTKTALVLDLLRRDTGATLDELVVVTGWLPHTTRAALTGLRKKGHAIMRGKRDEVSCYSLVAA